MGFAPCHFPEVTLRPQRHLWYPPGPEPAYERQPVTRLVRHPVRTCCSCGGWRQTGAVPVLAAEVLREMSAHSLRRFGFDPLRLPRVETEVLGRELLVSSSELQATATVLVMLDLIAEADAEEILLGHQRALDARGVQRRGVHTGELTLQPTSAHGFQAARRRPVESLLRRPVAVAAPGVTISVGDVEVLVEWLAVAAGETRGRGVISARGHGRLPDGPVEVVIPCADDAGNRYECRVWAGHRGLTVRPSPRSGSNTVTAEIHFEPPLPLSATGVELRPPGGSACHLAFHPSDDLRSGRVQPLRQAPGEWLLDALLPDLVGGDAGVEYGVGLDRAGARQVCAAVAEGLLAVGALPASSRLLSGYPKRAGRWPQEIARRATGRAQRAFAAASRPRRVAAVGVAVPLEQGVVAFDAVVVQGHDVWLHVYVFPDARGEYWPIALRPFRIEAVDDLGHLHQTVPASYWSNPGHEGAGDLWLWPPLEPDACSLRLTVSTPWETAWTEVT